MRILGRCLAAMTAIFFDDTTLYFVGRCLDSHPERVVANAMRRDSSTIFSGGDSLTLVLDRRWPRPGASTTRSWNTASAVR